MSTEAKTEILEKLNENIKKMDEKSIGFLEGYATAMAAKNDNNPKNKDEEIA